MTVFEDKLRARAEDHRGPSVRPIRISETERDAVADAIETLRRIASGENGLPRFAYDAVSAHDHCMDLAAAALARLDAS